MNDKYIEWVKLLSEITDEKKVTVRKINKAEALQRDIVEGEDGDILPIKITDHAMTQIHRRLADLANKSPKAFDDIMNKTADASLLDPDNLECFIFTMVSKAYGDNSIKKKKSRSGSTEYVFNVNISKWKTKNKELVFSMMVENNVVKTGFFNLVDKK